MPGVENPGSESNIPLREFESTMWIWLISINRGVQLMIELDQCMGGTKHGSEVFDFLNLEFYTSAKCIRIEEAM